MARRHAEGQYSVGRSAMRVRRYGTPGPLHHMPVPPICIRCAREVDSPTGGESGHIGGTWPRDLLRSSENRRDLSRRSGGMLGASALVMSAYAQDPAYRPARLPLVLWAAQTQGAHDQVAHPSAQSRGPLGSAEGPRRSMLRGLPGGALGDDGRLARRPRPGEVILFDQPLQRGGVGCVRACAVVAALGVVQVRAVADPVPVAPAPDDPGQGGCLAGMYGCRVGPGYGTHSGRAGDQGAAYDESGWFPGDGLTQF